MPSQEILKIRDGTPLETEEILTYIKSPQNRSFWHFYSNLDVPSNVVHKKRVARNLFIKIRPSQEILKIRHGTPLVARILFIKIRPSQEILKIRDDKKRVARILFFKIRPSQEILKIRHGTPLETEEILTYIKSPQNRSFWHFYSNLDVPSNVVHKKRVARNLFIKIRLSQEILKIRDGTSLEMEEILTYIKKPSKQIGLILFFKIRPSQEILKIRHGTPLETEEILTYIKSPQNRSFWHFYSNLDVPSNVVQKKRVARILFFKIRPSQEILKIRDVARNLFIKIRPSQEILKIRDVQKKIVARILFFKIRPSQEILKIRDGTPLETEEILTYIKSPQNRSFWHFYSKLDVPSNVVHKKRVGRNLFIKIRPSQEILKIRDGTSLEMEEILTYIKKPSKQIEILKIRDGTPLEAEEILIYIKKPSNKSVWHFSSNLDVPTNVVQRKRVAQILFFKIRPSQEILKILQKKRVARILFFKIRPSQEILKIRDGTPLENVPINVVQKKRVARILFFKIRPSQEILKIRDGNPLEAEEILIYIKKPSNKSVWHFSSNLDVPINVVQKKRVARILFFKIRPSQEILKIRDGNPLEAEEILIYIKKPSNKSVCHFSNNLDVPINVVQKKRVARILFFKIRPSEEILKIRDGTPLEAEEILIYIKKPSNKSVWHFSSKLDIISNVVQKKRVARILFFKIRPSQEILKIRDDVPSNVVHKKRVARNLFIKIRPSQEILKIRDGTSLETEEILIYIKSPQNKSVWHFSSNLDVPINVVQKKRVARILFFKIRPSQEILKIRDGNPLEAEEILIYIKKPSNKSVWHFSSNLDVPINVVQKKRVARILFFKIRPSQEILKIRDGNPLEAEEILIYIKKPSNKSVCHFSSNLDVPINVVQKKRVARILFFKIRPSEEILKIRDGTPLEAEEILIYIKKPSNKSVWHFSSKLDIISNVVQKKRVARILFFKIRPSQEILKIRDDKKRVARILFFKIRPSQEIIKIRHGTPLETEEILTYIKSPQNRSFWHFYSNLDVPSNVVHKKRVAWNLFIKIRLSQEILKIRDVQKKRVAQILFFKIRPSQEILKIRHGTPLETEEILTYIKSPQNRSFWHFYSNLDVPSNVVQKKRVARILFFKIRPSQEILKIRDEPSQEILKIHDVARILFFKIRPSQEILKIRDGTPLETEEILTYIKSPQNRSFWHFYSKLDVPSNVVHKKRVGRNLFIKIRPSQEILKIRDGTSLEMEEILTYIKKPSKQIEILKIRDGTPLEAEEILIYIKKPSNKSVWHFSSNLDVPTNVVQRKRVAQILFFKIRPSQEILKILQKKRVARILFFKIRPSQEILKIRDGTPLEKKRVARILFFKIRPSQEILKIRDGNPLEAEEILIYIKKPSNKSVWHFSSNLDVPINVVQKKRVARILFFKIRPSEEILKIRDGTPLEAEEILIYIKKPSNKSVWHFSSKLDIISNVVQKKRVARILFFKIRPSQEILKIRDGTSLETEEILTYIKKPSKQIGLAISRNSKTSSWYSFGDGRNFDIHKSPQNRSKKRVARILFFKIRPSQEILKLRHGTPLETEEILTYIKSPQNKSVWHFYSNLDVPSNVVQKKRVARILFFKIRPSQEILKIRDVARNLFIKIRPSQEILKIRDVHKKRVGRNLFIKIRPSQEILKIRDDRPSQEILKIRDGTPLEAEEILIYIKKPSNKSVWHFSSNLDVPTNVVQRKRVKKRVARILFFKIRPSQEILKIRDGTPLEVKEILIYIKIPQNKSVWHFYSNLDVPSNVVHKKRVARILFSKLGHLKKF
ncbi:hypothetical protein OROHE_004297 [Orobanche hederae]